MIRRLISTGPVALLLSVAISLFAPVRATTVTLPVYGLDGYHAELHVVNPSAQPVAMPHFWDPIGYGATPPTLPPFYTLTWADWPRPSFAGIVDVDVPAPLVAYVEDVAPDGSALRLPVMAKQTGLVQVQDLHADNDHRGHVWISSEHGWCYSVNWTHDGDSPAVKLETACIDARGTAILSVPAGANRATVQPQSCCIPGDPTFYVFGYDRRQTGRMELQFPIAATVVSP